MFVIKVRRPDGKIENIKKPGKLTEEKFSAMKKATADAGRGDLLEWKNLIGKNDHRPSEKEIKMANLKQEIVRAHNSNNAWLVSKLEKQLETLKGE